MIKIIHGSFFDRKMFYNWQTEKQSSVLSIQLRSPNEGVDDNNKGNDELE